MTTITIDRTLLEQANRDYLVAMQHSEYYADQASYNAKLTGLAPEKGTKNDDDR